MGCLRPPRPDPPPLFRVPGPSCPFLAGRQVPDHSLKPHVDPLPFETRHRDGDAPIDVAGDGPVLQAFVEVSEREIEDVLTPVGLLLDPFLELALEGGEFEEEMLRVAELRRRAAGAAAGGHEFCRVQRLATLVALVAPGPGETTVRARALNIPVGQETPALRT